jgi:hypothetical protein
MRSEAQPELPPRSSSEESWELQFDAESDSKDEEGAGHDQPQ